MEARCSHCGAQHVLDDTQVAGHARVQFCCTKCGQMALLELPGRFEASVPHERQERAGPAPPQPAPARKDAARNAQAQDTATGSAASRLQRFAHAEGTVLSKAAGLALPKDKTITLSVIAGPSKGLKHELSKPRVIVGRAGSGADMELDDPEVSRQHCAIEVTEDAVRVHDLGSTNGTFLDETSVRVADIEHLSEFRAGRSLLLITILPKQR